MEARSTGTADEPAPPLVTVGLPVFQGERYLAQALDALLAQDHRSLEVVVSDNASTDRSAVIAGEYARRDPRVRLRRNAENLGAWRNANLLLEEARGAYFMWAAHDDLWEPGFVSTLLARLQEDPDAALAFCAFDQVDEDGERVRLYPEIRELPHADLATRLERFMLQPEERGKANLLYGLYRTEVLRAAGGMTIWAADSWGADVLVVFRVLSLGGLTLVPDLLFHKRLVRDAPSPDAPGAAPSARGWRAELATRRAYLAGYERLVDEAAGLTPAERARLRKIARRRIRSWTLRTRWRKLVWNRFRRLGRAARRLRGGAGRRGSRLGR